MKTFILVLIFWMANLIGSEQMSVRMIGADSQPIIKGKLNGENAYFLIDSGSDATILNFRDVKKYGINYAKSILIDIDFQVLTLSKVENF